MLKCQELWGPFLILAITVIYFQMHSTGLNYEILNLESLKPMKLPAPRLSQATSLAFTCYFLRPRVPTLMLPLVTLHVRLLFGFGERDSQKINASEFSLALSNTELISLMDSMARSTP